MKDQGLNRSLVQKFDTSKFGESKAYYGFRKMFWDYLTKLHVGFNDPCCETAGGTNVTGARFNLDTGVFEFWDPADSTWKPAEDWVATTTTTTTAAPITTTTTTAAPTTTTTTTT